MKVGGEIAAANKSRMRDRRVGGVVKIAGFFFFKKKKKRLSTA